MHEKTIPSKLVMQTSTQTSVYHRYTMCILRNIHVSCHVEGVIQNCTPLQVSTWLSPQWRH